MITLADPDMLGLSGARSAASYVHPQAMTHGATIGHVDEEQLHYLMARGLPKLEAQRLIVEGFFAPVLDRIPLETVRDQLRAEIERKIG